MTDTLSAATAWWTRPWLSAAASLDQPILPGWSFAGVVVNEQNSSAPQTEQAIVAADSYGRQIGKLLDAVVELIQAQPQAKPSKAYEEVLALQAKVERTKQKAAAQRIDQFERDLRLLKAKDPKAFDEKVAALRALIA